MGSSGKLIGYGAVALVGLGASMSTSGTLVDRGAVEPTGTASELYSSWIISGTASGVGSGAATVVVPGGAESERPESVGAGWNALSSPSSGWALAASFSRSRSCARFVRMSRSRAAERSCDSPPSEAVARSSKVDAVEVRLSDGSEAVGVVDPDPARPANHDLRFSPGPGASFDFVTSRHEARLKLDRLDADEVSPLLIDDAGVVESLEEIGRASCRERVS